MRHQTLLEAARGGDAVAIHQLLVACQPDIRRYAQRNCLISDVDDAIQESLLILSRRVSSLRAVAAFSSWMFSIVRRECHRMARKALAADPWDDARVETWLAPRCRSTISGTMSWGRSNRCRLTTATSSCCATSTR
ncbi:MAG TPA: sigma-70 family RNA polymerase sigma factor [Paraburkholderia sp.]|nr:sigma-70 family RNA polymerase sigma factor [Paraburkholderia sp.]